LTAERVNERREVKMRRERGRREGKEEKGRKRREGREVEREEEKREGKGVQSIPHTPAARRRERRALSIAIDRSIERRGKRSSTEERFQRD
jgi:hypothetical protein